MRAIFLGAASAAAFGLSVASVAADQPKTAETVAAAFGARPWMRGGSLSPDGSHIAFIAPGDGKMNAAVVIDIAKGVQTPVLTANGNPLKLEDCGWSAADRLVCSLYGITIVGGQRLSFRRLLAINSDGSHQMPLGRKTDDDSLGINQYDGSVIDWMAGEDGNVLMTRNVLAKQSTGTLMAVSASGLGVERVNTRTGAAGLVEMPNGSATNYYSDGNGVVRMMEISTQRDSQMLTGVTVYRYRTPGNRAWLTFSRVAGDGPGLRPLAVDGTLNVAYAVDKKDGRDALYRIALDGTMKSEPVYADPKVDVDSIVTVGRRGRVIGFVYVTDQSNVVYFDPEYKKLAAQLSRALPNLPMVDFVDTSADEQKVIVHAASPTDSGHFYLLDRATHKMIEISPERPALTGYAFGTVKTISYPAADGTMIPAYLTLPPGSDGRKLPALVMPHGGPSDRDSGGFDYLAQFFAQRGFAVIQPEYRGSSGYGDTWGTALKNNGIKGWRTAMNDVLDSGRWMVKQGIADPSKLAIFGWSYGGYAALQSSVVDPTLFKAIVAVAPVTDFGMWKSEAQNFTNADIVNEQLGDETVAQEGSPARHAAQIQVPVLMFQGDNDLNVGIGESRAMDAALRRAGKQSRLVVYPGLDHQLDDNKARADMLAQSDAFLRAQLKLAQP